MAKVIHVIGHDHFDPLWVRCFRRTAVYNGTHLRPYAEGEALVFDTWRRLSEKGYTWSEGQAAVWREYIARRPDVLPELRKAIADGLLEIVMCGEIVPDSNMSTSEGLIRNYLAALPLYEELCGLDHPGLRIVSLEDGFGYCPNYPQLLADMGCDTLAHISYCKPGRIWTGIDGTRITVMEKSCPREHVWSFLKYPPCPDCRGEGCDACDGTGMNVLTILSYDDIRARLTEIIEDILSGAKTQGGTVDVVAGVGESGSDSEVAWILAGGEEAAPYADLPDVMAELNEKYAGKVELRFGTYNDVYEAHRGSIDGALEAEPEAEPDDFNPAQPGCYVTRIKLKQRTRAIGSRLVQAEAGLANRQWEAGKPEPPASDVARAWQNICFAQFHDAITGTHVDSAYDELMEMLDDAEAVADGLDAPPAPAPPPPAGTEIDGRHTVRLGELDCTFDLRGLRQVLCDGNDLFQPFANRPFNIDIGREPWCIGELCLEPDFGDAWKTYPPPFHGPMENLHMLALGEYHHTMCRDGERITWHGRYEGGHPQVHRFEWSTTVQPSPDGERLDFHTEIDWDTSNRRLRVIIPIADEDEYATWEVLFGHVNRRYVPGKCGHGDYPALNWVHKTTPEAGESAGVALITRGLPCVRWLPRRMDLSLLRSPEYDGCGMVPQVFEFWDIDGMRDAGQHSFDYSIWPHVRAVPPVELTRAGYAFNGSAPAVPFEINGNVQVTAWKPAQDGNGWVLRVQEAEGADSRFAFRLPRPMRITVCNILEQGKDSPTVTDSWQETLPKFKIRTLRIETGDTA